jgi:membrane-associated protease RseP (regulator of RpoE activity)
MALLITQLDSGGIASKASFQVGDIIEKYDGKPVMSVVDLRLAISSAAEAGADEVTAEIVRDGESLTLNCTTGSLGATFGEVAGSSLDSTDTLISTSRVDTDRYQFARVLCLALSLFGALCVAVGVVGTFVILDEYRSTFSDAIPAMALCISGGFILLGTQATRAVLDIADHSRQILMRLQEK